MVFPKFKGMLGRKRDNWRPRRLATILLENTTTFIHRHRRLNYKTLAPVNLGDRAKTYWLKNRTSPHPIRMINEKLKFQSPDRLVDRADKRKPGVGLCEPANKPNPAPIRQNRIFKDRFFYF
jgi:hypothetical protein